MFAYVNPGFTDMSGGCDDQYFNNTVEYKPAAINSNECCAGETFRSFDGLSWHEHVYRKLNNKPTPHYIENILGLHKSDSETEMNKKVEGSETCTEQPGVTDVNEPLNLSVKSQIKVRTRNPKEPTRKRKKPKQLPNQQQSADGKCAAEQQPPAMVVVNQKEPDLDQTAEDADCKNKKKKARTTFTGRQIFELEKQFEVKKYLSSSERSEMAKLLNVTETQNK
ncbi:unnamed protein product [Acanthoscelides obtectus]|uniref:Homeobox domain-containing protein n=1 Tax=Acanthoscelides obtectus TaxID=200917 RepID=A0A9P0KNV9_ACAOB|nr:unnamed protein product [Acanthoscelides obtectus]CAK1628641.1 Homeobox protein ceh-9 [Acanthoscelides obtectus]